ncbi:MAG: autotransporter-associated beta strand repeat-containing protein, partial [Planctomycetes bacterium]|nr:autotransporter-associated beta strand repeat-containing protein [Planctomycetota bacterium]
FTMIAQGGGTIEFNAANTFLTNTAGSWMRIDGGTTVRVNAVANGGVASPLGQASATAAQLRINGGTIDYVGTGHSTNRLFALTANSAITSNGTGALAYTGTGNIAYTTTSNVASNGRILTLGGANAADNTFRPNLVDGTTASGLTKTGTGLWIVSGTNTYTGNTTVSGGTLVVPATGALPGWNSVGRWSVASGAALGIGNSFTDANIATLFGTGNFLSGGSFGFSTAAGNRTFSENLADTVAGPLGLVKSQANTLTLGGTNTYTGGTRIDGGAVIVNGSLGTGTVSLGFGTTLRGSGTIAGTIAGSGTVSVGNSPGILTAVSVDPTGGLGWDFEITGSAPAWATPTASVNDVLRLTDATSPFTSSLTGANAVDFLFALPGADPISAGTYTVGLFTDRATNFAADVANAAVEFWVLGEFGSLGDRQQFNVGAGGSPVWYTRMAAYDSALSASLSVVPMTADFGSGNVSGFSTSVVVVPEPASLVLAGLGLALAGAAAYCRRSYML